MRLFRWRPLARLHKGRPLTRLHKWRPLARLRVCQVALFVNVSSCRSSLKPSSGHGSPSSGRVGSDHSSCLEPSSSVAFFAEACTSCLVLDAPRSTGSSYTSTPYTPCSGELLPPVASHRRTLTSLRGGGQCGKLSSAAKTHSR